MSRHPIRTSRASKFIRSRHHEMLSCSTDLVSFDRERGIHRLRLPSNNTNYEEKLHLGHFCRYYFFVQSAKFSRDEKPVGSVLSALIWNLSSERIAPVSRAHQRPWIIFINGRRAQRYIIHVEILIALLVAALEKQRCVTRR